MMKQMRENTKVILWIVVIAFTVTIFAVWGMDLQTGSGNQADPNLIGKVNDTHISRQQYQAVYEQMIQMYTASDPGKQIPYSQQEMILTQAWNSIVYNILTRAETEKLGLEATDDEIRYFLRNTPPPEIQQYFQDENGNFDYQAYQTALNNPEIDWTSLESLARDRIPVQKLQTFLEAMVHVSISEVRQNYEEQNTEMSVEYVEFPVDNNELGEYTPSSDEIQAFYDANHDMFTIDEQAILTIVSLDIKASRNDIEEATYTAELVSDQLNAGEEFNTLVRTYSQAPTAAANGETGYIRAGQRGVEYFAALQTMEVGKITSPVKTESGYYILKLLDKRVSDEGADEFSVQEILLKIEPGYGTIDSLRTIATELHEKAEQQGLIQAATDTNLTVITTQAFFQNYPIEGFGFSPKLSEFAFSNEKGTLSGVMRDDTRFFIATVSDRIPESLKPITDADIQEIILEQLKIEKVKKIAHDKARAFFQQAVATDFQSTLDNMGLTSQKPEPFQVSKNIERFGAYSPFATAAFALNTGGISPPIESHGSYFVIKLLSRTPFDAADYETKMASIGSRLFQEKVQEFMVYWYGKLEENSNIEDYREAF